MLSRQFKGITLEKFNSYGKDSNRILETLMDTEERPQEVQEKLSEVFKIIETGNLEEAKKLRKDLNNEIGDDPLLLKADVLIKRKEILKR